MLDDVTALRNGDKYFNIIVANLDLGMSAMLAKKRLATIILGSFMELPLLLVHTVRLHLNTIGALNRDGFHHDVSYPYYVECRTEDMKEGRRLLY